MHFPIPTHHPTRIYPSRSVVVLFCPGGMSPWTASLRISWHLAFSLLQLRDVSVTDPPKTVLLSSVLLWRVIWAKRMRWSWMEKQRQASFFDWRVGEVWTWALEDPALLAGSGKGLLYRDVVDGEEPACSSRESSCVARAPDPNVESGICTPPSQAAISHQEVTKSGTSARTTLWARETRVSTKEKTKVRLYFLIHILFLFPENC